MLDPALVDTSTLSVSLSWIFTRTEADPSPQTVVVAGNQSVKSATRITQIAGFSGTLCAALCGVIVRYTRYLKPLIIFGEAAFSDQATNAELIFSFVRLLR